MATYKVHVTRGEKQWDVFVEMVTASGARRHVQDMLGRPSDTYIGAVDRVSASNIQPDTPERELPAEQYATIFMWNGKPQRSDPMSKYEAVKATKTDSTVIGVVRRTITDWMPYRGGIND